MNTAEPTALLNGLRYTLTELEMHCWSQLVSAPQRKKDGFKTFTAATRSATGADARTVVLRQADAAEKIIWFHSDCRATKLDQLREYPLATLLFWDDAHQIQLRLTVTTTLHQADAAANVQWAALWVGSRKMYLSAETPGSEQAEPYPGFPPGLADVLPTEAESEAGRANFIAIRCAVLTMEYLHLSRSGQTRARFSYQPDRRFSWLAP